MSGTGWEDVRAEVLRRIRARDWPPGAVIPGEEALAGEFLRLLAARDTTGLAALPLSAREFEERFSGQPEATADGLRFPVEAYLLARGDALEGAELRAPRVERLRRLALVAVVDEIVRDAEAVEPLRRLLAGVAVLQTMERRHA